MSVARLAASGLLLLSLLALSLDGKPLEQRWLGPEIPPLEQNWLGPEIPPLEQNWLGPEIPPLEQKRLGPEIPPLEQNWLGPEIPPVEQKRLGPEIPPLEQSWPSPKVPPLEQRWRGLLQPEGPPLMEPHELSAGGPTALREEPSPRAEAAQHPGGGGGSGNQPPNGNGCFGHKIDRVNHNGFGCNKVDDHKGQGGP